MTNTDLLSPWVRRFLVEYLVLELSGYIAAVLAFCRPLRAPTA